MNDTNLETSEARHSKLKQRRSEVRVYVTYLAAAFVFLGGGIMIAVALFTHQGDLAKDLFFTILPIGTGVITFWFAGRSAEKIRENQQQ